MALVIIINHMFFDSLIFLILSIISGGFIYGICLVIAKNEIIYEVINKMLQKIKSGSLK